MEDYAGREYAALRETIRSRGGARPFAFLMGLIGWGAVLIGVLAWLANPIASVVPLLVLLATFEVLRSLHLGVERIGRYVQVFFEENANPPTAPPAWEHTAMIFGPSIPGAGVHPYFLPVFFLATVVNFLAVLFPGPVLAELVTLAVPHVAFLIWMVYCDRGMRKQRGAELARYREVRNSLRPHEGAERSSATSGGAANPRSEQ
jgi:hypothetical protein